MEGCKTIRAKQVKACDVTVGRQLKGPDGLPLVLFEIDTGRGEPVKFRVGDRLVFKDHLNLKVKREGRDVIIETGSTVVDAARQVDCVWEASTGGTGIYPWIGFEAQEFSPTGTPSWSFKPPPQGTTEIHNIQCNESGTYEFTFKGDFQGDPQSTGAPPTPVLVVLDVWEELPNHTVRQKYTNTIINESIASGDITFPISLHGTATFNLGPTNYVSCQWAAQQVSSFNITYTLNYQVIDATLTITKTS